MDFAVSRLYVNTSDRVPINGPNIAYVTWTLTVLNIITTLGSTSASFSVAEDHPLPHVGDILENNPYFPDGTSIIAVDGEYLTLSAAALSAILTVLGVVATTHVTYVNGALLAVGATLAGNGLMGNGHVVTPPLAPGSAFSISPLNPANAIAPIGPSWQFGAYWDVSGIIGFNSFVIKLPNYIEGVVYMELLNATTNFAGILIQIEEWGLFTTSKGRLYWRYVDDSANQRSVAINETVIRSPQRLQQITFSLYNTDGSPKTITGGGFEIEIYSRRGAPLKMY